MTEAIDNSHRPPPSNDPGSSPQKDPPDSTGEYPSSLILVFAIIRLHIARHLDLPTYTIRGKQGKCLLNPMPLRKALSSRVPIRCQLANTWGHHLSAMRPIQHFRAPSRTEAKKYTFPCTLKWNPPSTWGNPARTHSYFSVPPFQRFSSTAGCCSVSQCMFRGYPIQSVAECPFGGMVASQTRHSVNTNGTPVCLTRESFAHTPSDLHYFWTRSSRALRSKWSTLRTA